MTRRWKALATSALLVALALTAAAAPSGAQPREGLTVVEGQTAQGDYPPIPGNYPVAPTVNWTPGGCNDSAIGNVCDTVPLEIVVPDLGPVDDFYVTIEVSWDDPEGLNDLDIYLWDDTQIQASQGDDTPSWTRMNQSATSANPETIRQFSPTLGTYNLTIVNWSGPNLGYTVKAFITVAEFDEPFELLAPNFTAPTESATPDSVPPPPFDFSAVDQVQPGPVAPTFGEIPVQPDTELDFGPSDFERNLAAPPPLIGGTPASSLRPPREVPGLVAAFWLGGVPTLLVGACAVLLARRRRDAFSYA